MFLPTDCRPILSLLFHLMQRWFHQKKYVMVVGDRYAGARLCSELAKKTQTQQHSLLLITARPFPLTPTRASFVRYDVLPTFLVLEVPGLARLMFQMTAKVPLHVYKSGVRSLRARRTS
ncbi:hypothetical protein BC826DRAFT_250 [Russula brevipes]|nr:hypothetical protein BC826DRAFT_250 [Russula brevipes]